MRVALHSAGDPFLQSDCGFVTHVPFGALTAVKVVGSSQSHSHWSKGGFEGHKRTQDQCQQPEEHGQPVDEPVGEVVARRLVSQTHQHLRHEVPESDRLIIGDVVRLKRKKTKVLKIQRREKQTSKSIC